MSTVNLIDVSKQVGQISILDKINVDIVKGEFMVVVGPSGCGKSTLLRLIAGLDDPSSGKILINNECVNNIPPAKRDMAMVFQNYALYPHMNVFDNIAYGLKLRGINKELIGSKVQDVAKLLHLTPYLDRKPAALSGGQKQRVAMGRAIVRSPAVYLFDEPLSNLDSKLRTEMRHEIKRLHQQFQITSLYVTHDQTEAMTLADRVIVLNQGVIEQVGTPQDLYQNPANPFVAGFTGHYPVNFFKGAYNPESDKIMTSFGIEYAAEGWKRTVKQKELIMAIRPEHVKLSSQQSKDSIEIMVEFVDDMGADKFIQGKSVKNGELINIRVTADQAIDFTQLFVELPRAKIHLFQQQSGNATGDKSG